MKLKASPYVRVSYAMIVGVMGTALISPLYGLYRETWNLNASDISLLYVIYMAGALCSLLFLGSLPDRLGFRRMLLTGLSLCLVGTLMSLLAWDIFSLDVARFVVGLASGMVTTSAPLGLSELSSTTPSQRPVVSTGFLMAIGFGLGPLIGGIIGQWGPSPLVTTYVPALVLGAVGVYSLYRLQLPSSKQGATTTPIRWRDLLPKLTWPEGESSWPFALTTCISFLAFGVFGLYAAMSPLFLDKLVSWHGPVVSGTVIALILFISACVQIVAVRISTHRNGCYGLVSMALANVALMANLWVGSGLLFVLGVLLTAVGHGMSMLAGVNMVNRVARPHNRAGLFATFMVIGYFGSMAPLMGMGWIADHWGLKVAVCTFSSFVIAMAGTTAVLFRSNPRIRRADEPLSRALSPSAG